MIRERIRLKLFRLNEENMQREDEYSYTEEDRSYLVNELERAMHGHMLIDENGFAYYVSVTSIVDDD